MELSRRRWMRCLDWSLTMPEHLSLFWNCFFLCVMAVAVLMVAGGPDGPDDWDGAA